jgi:DNA-binding transcriptional ArsR family regulator
MLRNAAPADLPDNALEALGNPERRRLLRLLAEGGPQSVGQLAAGFPISRPAISRHLKLLLDAGLVRQTPAGTRNVYRLDQAGFAATAAWLNGFWDEAERRLRLVAENLAEGSDD